MRFDKSPAFAISRRFPVPMKNAARALINNARTSNARRGRSKIVSVPTKLK